MILALFGTVDVIEMEKGTTEVVTIMDFSLVDVMYSFAGQTNGMLEATLRHVVSLAPEYATLYRMRYKGTSLAFQAQNVSFIGPPCWVKTFLEMLRLASALPAAP